MSADENKDIVRRFYNALLNEKRLDRLDEFVAQDYIDHSALPGQAPGLEGSKERWAVWMAAIPDLRSTLDDMLGEGDRFGARWTREGTHQGSLPGIPRAGGASGSAA